MRILSKQSHLDLMCVCNQAMIQLKSSFDTGFCQAYFSENGMRLLKIQFIVIFRHICGISSCYISF